MLTLVLVIPVAAARPAAIEAGRRCSSQSLVSLYVLKIMYDKKIL